MSNDQVDQVAEQLELAGLPLLFAREYAINRDGKAAAIRAGYNVKGAGAVARALLREPAIEAYLVASARSMALEALGDRRDVSRQALISSIWKVHEEAMNRQPVVNKHGDTIGYRIDSMGANKALELLAKVGGHLQADKGSGGAPVSVAFTFQIAADSETQTDSRKVSDLIPDSDEDDA